MKGQHIYMRYRTEQGLAGTWTAAVTKDVLDSNTLNVMVLPRCNLDEVFANDMLRRPGSSVLRIYPVKGGALVVSRSFWETDALTESSGRKGAYTVSHVFTGKDRVEFTKNCYANAANSSLFEPYASVASRMRAVGPSRFSVDDSYSLTDTVSAGAGIAALENAGLTKEQFLSLMHLILCRKRVAVVLPQALRRDWIENGVDHGAAFAIAFAEFFPYWMRMYLSLASAWSCRVGNEMTHGLNLLFVYPGSTSSLSELRSSDCFLLDLENSAPISDVTLPTSRDYLDFLWETRRDPSQREAFWDYCAGTLGLVEPEDGGWPSEEALELAFHLYAIVRGNVELSPEQYRRYFLETSEHMHDVSSQELESFKNRAVSVFTEQNLPIDDALESALAADLEQSSLPTQRQQNEYALLFSRIFADSASRQSFEVLTGELDKPERGAAALLAPILERELDRDAFPGRNSERLVAWILGLYEQYCSASLQKDALFLLLSEIVPMWVKASCEGSFREDAPHMRLLRACLVFLRSGEPEPAQMREFSYRSLLRCEWLSQSPKNIRSCASNSSSQEEAYFTPESAQAYSYIPSVFLSEFERCCPEGQCSQRLLRRFFQFSALSEELLEKALRIYETNRASLPPDAAAIRAEVLAEERLPCRSSAAFAFETQDLQADPRYRPSSSLLRQTLLNMGARRRELLPEVYLPYLQRMGAEERPAFCRMIRELNGDGSCGLENLLFLALADSADSSLAPAISAELGGDLNDRLSMFSRHMQAEESPALRKSYQDFFIGWYLAYLNKSFSRELGRNWSSAPDRLCSFLRRQFEDLSAAGKDSDLCLSAKKALADTAWENVRTITGDEQLKNADRSTLESLQQLLPFFSNPEASAITQKVDCLSSVDDAVTGSLDAACAQAEDLGLQQLAAHRLRRSIQARASSAGDTGDASFSDNRRFAMTVHYLLLRDGCERFSVPAICGEYGIAESDLPENVVDAAFNLYRYADKFSQRYKDVLINAGNRALGELAQQSPEVFERKRVKRSYADLKSKSWNRAASVCSLLQGYGVLMEGGETRTRFGLPLTIVFCLLAALFSVSLVLGTCLLSLVLLQKSTLGLVAALVVGSLLGAFFLLLSFRLRKN